MRSRSYVGCALNKLCGARQLTFTLRCNEPHARITQVTFTDLSIPPPKGKKLSSTVKKLLINLHNPRSKMLQDFLIHPRCVRAPVSGQVSTSIDGGHFSRTEYTKVLARVIGHRIPKTSRITPQTRRVRPHCNSLN